MPEKKDEEAIAKVVAEIAKQMRVDVYPSPDEVAIERGDLYLKQRSRDATLYRFDHDGLVPSPYKDSWVCRFIGTKKALFHLELNALLTDMVQLVRASDLGLTMSWSNDATFFRGIQVENVGSVIEVVSTAMRFKVIRRKERQT